LFDAMQVSRAFDNGDRDRLVAKFKKTLVANVIREAMIFDQTKDWYCRHVPKADVPKVLKMAGLWNAGLDKDWMSKNLTKKDMFQALVEFDKIGECSVEWIQKNVGKRQVREALARRGLGGLLPDQPSIGALRS
jgi:hypothetical protein